MTVKIRHSIRANKDYSKVYIDNLLKDFTPLYVKNYNKNYKHKTKIIEVQYGKQDMRGVPSITFIDDRHCVPHQNHFKNNAEMVAYIQGFLQATRGY